MNRKFLILLVGIIVASSSGIGTGIAAERSLLSAPKDLDTLTAPDRDPSVAINCNVVAATFSNNIKRTCKSYGGSNDTCQDIAEEAQVNSHEACCTVNDC